MISLTNALENMSRSVKECIADYLAQTELFEMAIDRNTFKKKVENIFPQIAQNWCLIRYARKNNIHTNLINHWKAELIAHMYSIFTIQLKSGSEYKAIVETVIKKLEYDDGDITVKAAIAAKFFTEDIIDTDDIEQKNLHLKFHTYAKCYLENLKLA